MYQNQIICIIIGFKHDVLCIVGSEALRGHSDTSVHSALRASGTDWSSWPLCVSDLTMHNIIMLKSLNTELRERATMSWWLAQDYSNYISNGVTAALS